MKKIFAMLFLAVLFAAPVFAQGADVNILVTKSLDDPTPRVSIFPVAVIGGVSYPAVFKNYSVEQNGALLAQTCSSGCTSLTVTGLPDSTYNFRLGSVVEVTRPGVGGLPEKVLSTEWSAIKSITVYCTIPKPDAPELGVATTVCK